MLDYTIVPSCYCISAEMARGQTGGAKWRATTPHYDLILGTRTNPPGKALRLVGQPLCRPSRQGNHILTLAGLRNAPLPWVPAATARWLREQPGEATGLGQLEQLALRAVRSGLKTPAEIFSYAKTHDLHPIFWGDITLRAKINNLTIRTPALVKLEGPAPLLPQWNGIETLRASRIYPA